MKRSMRAKEDGDCYFSKVGAAQYLGRSPRWLDYQLASLNPPPGYKVGKCWLFKKSELDRWLEQFRASRNLDQMLDEIVNDLDIRK